MASYLEDEPLLKWSYLEERICSKIVAISFNILKESNPWRRDRLTLKAPITTAANDIHIYFFIVFRENKT